MNMRFVALGLLNTCVSIAACPNLEKNLEEYLTQNFGGEEVQPQKFEKKIQRLGNGGAAIEIMVPVERDEPELKQMAMVLFFAGQSCEFALQSEGTLDEIIEVGRTRYVFVRQDRRDESEARSDFQLISATGDGFVEFARDQHGQDLYFSNWSQNRCENKVGDLTTWTRDKNDKNLMVIRQRHVERDEKCRLVDDASTYRYYRLTAEHWRLDDGTDESQRPEISSPTRKK